MGGPQRFVAESMWLQEGVRHNEWDCLRMDPHLNRMTPSGWNERHGCRLISTMRSVVSERSRKDGCRLASSWYALEEQRLVRLAYVPLSHRQERMGV